MSFFSREKVFDHCAENFGDLEIFEDDAGILDTVANHNIRFRASNNGFLSSKLPRAATIAAAGVPPCYRRAIAALSPPPSLATTGPPGHQATVAPPPPRWHPLVDQTYAVYLTISKLISEICSRWQFMTSKIR